MRSTDQPGKGYTPPKGRHTSAQDETDEKAPRISSTVQWIIVSVVLVGVLVAAFMFGTVRDPTNPHGGAPAPFVEQLVVDQI